MHTYVSGPRILVSARERTPILWQILGPDLKPVHGLFDKITLIPDYQTFDEDDFI